MVLVSTGACRKAGGPPAPLGMEQLPAEFDKAFARSNPGTRAVARRVCDQVRAGDYPGAFLVLQTLVTESGLTRDQAELAARGLVTLHNQLESAQTAGDTQSREALRYQRMTK